MELRPAVKPPIKYNAYEIANKVLKGELLLLDRPLKSKAWTVFARITNRDGVEIKEFVYCKSCGKVFKYIKITTSNLVRHKCVAERAVNTTNNNTMTKDDKITAEVDKIPVNNLAKLLTKWVLKDCRSCNIIKNENLKAVFQRFANVGSKFGSDIDAGSLLPNLSDVVKNISEIYEHCFGRVKADIASIKGNGFGLTGDVWNDTFTKQSYVALTIHYLKNGKLTFRLLGVKHLECEKSIKDHSIEKKINEILEDFDSKFSDTTIIVTDGSFNIRSFPEKQNVPCISQSLNNALLKSVDAVPEVTEIINSCSKLVNFLKQIEFSKVLYCLFQSSYPEHWQAICKMLKYVESNWNEIEETLQNKNEKSRIISVNIHRLKALIKTFQPFEDTMEMLEEDSYATLHLVMVYLHKLKTAYEVNSSEFKDIEFIENLKENIRMNLEKIVSENITTLHKLALFLYPPTNKLLQFSDEEKQCVEGECIRLMQCFKTELKPIIKQEREPTVTRVSKRRKLFSDFVVSELNRDQNQLIMEEIQYYKNTRVANTADFNVFSWWEMQKDIFPLLYKISCTVLATPATIAASKRILSAASVLLSEKSKQVSKEIDVEKIIFIKSNCDHDEIDRHFAVYK